MKKIAARSSLKITSSLEALETRIAPATFVNANLVTYTDPEGDLVSVSSTKPIFFHALGAFTFVNSGLGQQLETLNLPNTAAGAAISITAARANGNGDGWVNVGFINASGIDLLSVNVKGDLGKINAGDATTTTPAIGGLTLHSLGIFGGSTQATPSSTSNILGGISTLTINGDMVGASINLTGGANNVDGTLGTVIINGSIIGDTTNNSGQISAGGNIGLVTINGNIVGGKGDNSGEISAGGNILGLNIGGSLIGDGGLHTGEINVTGNAGLIHVGHDVTGGNSDNSGRIGVGGNATGISIGGSLSGLRNHSHTGEIIVGGSTGIVTVGGNITGSDNATASPVTGSGYIQAKHFTSVTVNGSIFSGSNSGGSTLTNSGAIRATDDIPLIHVYGDLVGNGTNPVVISARGQAAPLTTDLAIGSFIAGGRVSFTNIEAGYNTADTLVNANGSVGPMLVTGDFLSSSAVGKNFGTITIGGSVIGTQASTGLISATGGMGLVSIKGNLVGGYGDNSGKISSGGSALAITVGGSLIGGGGMDSAEISITGNSGLIHVGQDVTGGNADNSGRIGVGGTTPGISIGGSLRGFRNQSHTGEIIVGGSAGIVTIGGNINGSDNATQSHTSTPINITNTGYMQAGHFTSVTVNGSIYSGNNNSTTTIVNPGDGPGGTLTNSGAIRATNDIPLIHVYGDLVGNSTTPVVISARGQAAPLTTDLAIGSFIAGGRVSFTNIEAGYNTADTLVNANGSVGSMLVTGDFASSSALGKNFGTIGIGGSVIGTQAGTGLIRATGGMGLVTVRGNLVGGNGDNSGEISSGGSTLAVSVGGSLLGGGGAHSGEINVAVNAGLIHVGQDVTGGASDNSGRIEVGGSTPGISIGGSLNGARHNDTGEIKVGGSAGIVTIGGNINGGDNRAPGAITNTGYLQAGHFTSVTVNGSIFSGLNTTVGTLANSGAIRAANDIPLIHVFGSLVGNDTNPVVISARGLATVLPTATTNLAIGSLSVGGRMTYTNVEAGYNLAGTAVNGDAQIGTVLVTGDMIASNIVAGISNGGDGKFGDGNDALVAGTSAAILAKIGSVSVGGQALGTPSIISGTDSYGIEAESIPILLIGGISQAPILGAHNDNITLSRTTGGDLTVKEF